MNEDDVPGTYRERSLAIRFGTGNTREHEMQLLSDCLLRLEVIDALGLERGQSAAAKTGQRLDKVLVQLGLLTEQSLAEAYSEILDVPLATEEEYPESPVVLSNVNITFLRAARALPLRLDDEGLLLAVTDGLDHFAPAAVSAATGCTISKRIAIPVDIEAAFARLYPENQKEEGSLGKVTVADGVENDAERLRDIASETQVIRLVNNTLNRAVETLATDIHLDPCENRIRVRYRYDGVLHDIESIPHRLSPAIISRIKILARLDIAERRLPQDGRINFPVRGADIDFRVSTAPTLYGEKAVLRILDKSAAGLKIDMLGLPAHVAAKWVKALECPNGILLVTGPTGSGKTTTLYAGLKSIDLNSRNVITIEDPIEYQIAGTNQTQVRPQIGLTFAHMLRSVLRQDPDVIMVGEIRDLETAQIAAQAALTGHLVLSTLHTNSAATTITRLRDLGLEDFLVTAVLRGVIAQRLVRKLCNSCKREVHASPQVIAYIDSKSLKPCGATLWEASGCLECRGTGYRGRVAIAELLQLTSTIEKLIYSRANHLEIEEAAMRDGMITMLQHGLEAVILGVTTMEEIIRTIGVDVQS